MSSDSSQIEINQVENVSPNVVVETSDKKDKLIKVSGYLYGFRCNECREIYGSDYDKDNGICVVCRNKKRQETLNDRKERKKKLRDSSIKNRNKKNKKI